ncbi:MAG: 4Fe-4S dicluster domain-containing protein [Coriobacteriales bacterium]|jgi:Fe-S-cluster-containing hydrogenase component 2|nr:4Fe-4S dicluster domain-containing protein [Coriobacteriales bacterium]
MNARSYGPHIVQYPKEYSLCAGCTSCEIACSLTHDGVVGPRYNRIFLVRGTSSMIHEVAACMHCSDHPCYEACPEQGQAMTLDANNMVRIAEEFCTGCGRCMKACVFEPARINLVKSKVASKRSAKKCDLCAWRAEGPACIQYCPVRCIGLSSNPVPEYSPAVAQAPDGGQ